MSSTAAARTWLPALPGDLSRLRRIAVIVFAAQLVFILVWSGILWGHFSLTDDYAVYWQAWWKLNHGHLNPYDSFAHYSFWRDHGVLLMWPLALITHFGLGGYAPLAVQDLSVFAAEVIAFAWVLRILRDHGRDLPLPRWLLGATSLLFLVVNPWTYWALSFDLHFDVTLAAPFVVLTLRALFYRQYRWLPLWVVLGLLCGDVAATLVAAAGLSALLVGGYRRERGLFLAAAGVFVAGTVSFLVLTHLQSGAGAAAIVAGGFGQGGHAADSSYGRISSVLLHPGHLASSVWSQRTNLWALMSPAGPLGVVSPWGLPLVAATAVENSAAGQAFTFDGFQYAAVWSPLVVAGVLVACRLARYRRVRRVVAFVLVLSVVNTIVWSAVWLPRVQIQWLRVEGSTAKMLDRAQCVIPADAEVIASQGVVGRFADRDWAYAFPGNGTSAIKDVKTRDVYFVIVPFEGIELAQVDEALNLLGLLAGPMHASLVLHGDGVWVFHWQPAAGVTEVDLSTVYSNSHVPVWAARTQVGTPLLVGPSQDWEMTTASRAGGYLIDGAYYTRPLGQYELQVRLSTSGTVNVEAWNIYGGVLLGRRIVPETNGVTTVDVPVPNLHAYEPSVFNGGFGFSTEPLPPPAGQVLEARVYLPPSTTATVYSVRLVQVAS